MMKAKLFRAGYKKILRPSLFKFDPEEMHNVFISFGKFLGSNFVTKSLTSFMFNYQNKMLSQEIFGIKFKNPIGLAAGFDKNAEMISVMEDVGFGFVEAGSITKLKCAGNPGKRLLRIPEKKSLWVYMGLNNKGADEIYKNLKDKNFNIPIGISAAKTNCKETAVPEVAVDDYLYTVKKFKDIADYFTINISCPSAYGGQPFSDPKLFRDLMEKIEKLNIKKPIFVKLSPDLSVKNINQILSLSKKYNISGFVCTNLTKKNTGFEKGGLSGKAVEKLSNKMIAYVYKNTRNWAKKPIIIGVGGIFNAEDAYRKIKLGASLLQMITGMIYEGPAVIGEINQGFVRLLKKDGYENIGEAVGKGLY